MKRLLLIPSLVVLLALALVACAAPLATATPTTGASPTGATSGATPTAAAAGDQVSISGFAFDPGTLTVAVGTTVTWTNKDAAAHTVVFTGFQSGSLATGDTYTHKFDTAGTFAYACGVHPSMKGTIKVE